MKVVTFEEAVSYIHDKDTLMIGGSGGGHAVPEALIVALEERYLRDGSPRQITLFHPVGIGDNITQGVGHLAHPGLVKRIVAGALVNSPAFQKLAEDNQVEAYTLPQGALSELVREMASGRPGLLTQDRHAYLCRSPPAVEGKVSAPLKTWWNWSSLQATNGYFLSHTGWMWHSCVAQLQMKMGISAWSTKRFLGKCFRWRKPPAGTEALSLSRLPG